MAPVAGTLKASAACSATLNFNTSESVQVSYTGDSTYDADDAFASVQNEGG